MAFVVMVAAGAAPLEAQEAPRERGWIGIGYELRDGRPWVTSVYPGSPAAESGLQRGDVIVRVNGRAVTEESWRRNIWTPGQRVRFTIRRDGRERDVTVRAGERPGVFTVLRAGDGRITIDGDSIMRLVRVQLDSVRAHLDTLKLPSFHLERDDSTVVIALRRARADLEGAQGEIRHGVQRVRVAEEHVRRESDRVRRESDRVRREVLRLTPALGARGVAGAELSEINPGLAEHLPTDRGLLVLDVAPDTPAARAGLRAGDVITGAGGREIGTIGALRTAVSGAADNRLTLDVVRRDGRRRVTLAWDSPTVR